MHPAAYEWVLTHVPEYPVTVLDVGGRNINGTVRDLFHPSSRYTAIDLEPGAGVDVIADFRDYQPSEPVDVVVCCEVAEHTPHWPDLVGHAASCLKPSGLFIFTAAGPGRAPHSAIDGGPITTGEWYENITAHHLDSVLGAMFTKYMISVEGEDIRAVARR